MLISKLVIQAAKQMENRVWPSRAVVAFQLWLACGCGSSDDRAASARLQNDAPLVDCKPPSGAFTIDLESLAVSLATTATSSKVECSIDMSGEVEVNYDGTVNDLVDSGCQGIAMRSSASGCVFDVTETCQDVAIQFTLSLFESGEIDGTQTATNNQCSVRQSLEFARSGASQQPGSISASAAPASMANVAMTPTPHNPKVVMRDVTTTSPSSSAPALLFDDGWASLRAAASVIDDPDHSRAENAKDWVQWRLSTDGNRIEITSNGTWRSMGASYEYPPVDRGHALSDVYYTISANSNPISTAWNSTLLGLQADGSFAISNSYNIVSQSAAYFGTPTDQHGTYTIDGYILSMKFANRNTERHVLVSYEGKLRDKDFWIDNTFYCEAGNTSLGPSCK